MSTCINFISLFCMTSNTQLLGVDINQHRKCFFCILFHINCNTQLINKIDVINLNDYKIVLSSTIIVLIETKDEIMFWIIIVSHLDFNFSNLFRG